jgi:predicted outer membrane repeat protein
MYLDIEKVGVADSTFTRNTASVSGGAIHFECTLGTCENSIDRSTFVGNEAENGGAWRWMENAEPSWTDCSFAENWAAYAGNVAAIPERYVLITNDTTIDPISRSLAMSDPTIDVDIVTGQEITFDILLEMLDKYNRTVSTNSKTLSIIVSEDNTVEISGKTSTLSENGYSSWSKLIFVGETNKLHRFLITSIETEGNSTISDFPIYLWFRDCVPGEIFEDQE